MDIQVILTCDDPKLGKRGQTVKVSAGFAQNFLFPHGKAKPATTQNIKLAENEKAKIAKHQAEELAAAHELAAKIKAIQIQLPMMAGEGDKLFGAVTLQDILEALSKKGVSLDKKKIHLHDPIKKLGDFEVDIKLHPEVHTKLKIQVIKK